MKHKVNKMKIPIGDIALTKNEDSDPRKRKIGIVDELYYRRDDDICAAQLRLGKSFMQQPIQHLYPLELNCDIKREKEKDCSDQNEQLQGKCPEPRIKLDTELSRIF